MRRKKRSINGAEKDEEEEKGNHKWYLLNNRPGVVRAVLQTTLLLIH